MSLPANLKEDSLLTEELKPQELTDYPLASTRVSQEMKEALLDTEPPLLQLTNQDLELEVSPPLPTLLQASMNHQDLDLEMPAEPQEPTNPLLIPASMDQETADFLLQEDTETAD